MNAKLAGALLFGLVVTTSSYLGQTIPLEATAIGQEENVDARSQAEELLRRARTAMKGGNLQLADRLVTQAEKMNVDFSGFLSRFSDSPGKARRELTRLQQASSKASKPDRLPADAVDSANQLKRPIMIVFR